MIVLACLLPAHLNLPQTAVEKSMQQLNASGSFRTTNWSIVRRAAETDGSDAAVALSSLCQSYWYPLYVYFRRCGKTSHDSEDLTQGLFAHLLTRNSLSSADPARGRLRTFLLACAQNFLADQYDRENAQKRGLALLVPIEASRAEELYAREPQDALAPDRLFQRRWALTILEHALELLCVEYDERGQAELFQSLRPFLGFGSEPEMRYEEIAARLQIPIGTLKNKVFRMRQRWRELLFEQVAQTLDDPSPEEIKGELSELLGCV